MAPGEPDQPVSSPFFLAYSGSGLSIQRLARFQPTSSRRSARRIVSCDRTVALSPCSCATCANRASVQVLLAWPKVRGDRCRIARSRSSSAAPRTGAALLGREVLGRPGEKGAGHRADWSPVNEAQQHLLACRQP